MSYHEVRGLIIELLNRYGPIHASFVQWYLLPSVAKSETISTYIRMSNEGELDIATDFTLSLNERNYA